MRRGKRDAIAQLASWWGGSSSLFVGGLEVGCSRDNGCGRREVLCLVCAVEFARQR